MEKFAAAEGLAGLSAALRFAQDDRVGVRGGRQGLEETEVLVASEGTAGLSTALRSGRDDRGWVVL